MFKQTLMLLALLSVLFFSFNLHQFYDSQTLNERVSELVFEEEPESDGDEKSKKLLFETSSCYISSWNSIQPFYRAALNYTHMLCVDLFKPPIA